MLMALLAQTDAIQPPTPVIQWLVGIVAVVVAGVMIAGIVGWGKHTSDATKHLRPEDGYTTLTQFATCRRETREDISGLHESIGQVHARVDEVMAAQAKSTQQVLEAIGKLG